RLIAHLTFDLAHLQPPRCLRSGQPYLILSKNLALATSDAQNPVITQEEIDEAIEATEERIYEGITFKVQLAASKNKLEVMPYNFKGLEDISRNEEDGLYKYYYGETSDFNKIQLMKKFAREKGYPGSYVVAFQGETKVRLADILKSEDR
ncbi:MAG: hypothetical protein AAFP76_13380, partial [Bacteroidota bacterium]